VEVNLVEAKPTAENRIRRSGVIAHDPEKCIVCAGCVVRCSTYHEGVAGPELSRITLVADYYLTGNRSIAVCQQCEEPACLTACTSGALRVDSETGARYIDDAVCVGCGRCADACPLMPEVAVIKAQVSNGEIRYFKCDLCRGRKNGPVCIEFCPYSALTLVSSEERV
jgi:Fe-S-cluster-containing hydrogenase component 2